MSARVPAVAPSPPGLDRRRFIAAALAFAAGAGAWRLAPGGAPAGGGTAEAAALLASLSAPAAAARIGTAYLAAHPHEAGLDLLVRQIHRAVSRHSRAVPTAPVAMLAALTDLVEAEYCTATLVRADGWLLAPSEARLYALAALARGVGADLI